ncbi:MAG: SpoIIE family protein phosphatase [Clostridia bacterium]|nr:SpoIIE family protein phosphatase [Clostridia bacterium]
MSFVDYGHVSLNKKHEELCGDNVEHTVSNGVHTFVLADGLGSGVKANILATLTSKILCTMAAANIPLSDCIDTIIDSLPVCKVRGVAYATFTVISINEHGEGYLVEYDNPPAIYIRDGKLVPLERTERIYADKKVYFSSVKMNEGDQIITTSDGVVHAGIGMSLNFGWDIAEIREFMEIHYDKYGAAMTAASVLANACYSLYGKECGDDTSVLCVKLMPTRPTNIMIGPPVDPSRDEMVVGEFLASPGKHAVCGGTSSQVVARVMGKELTSSFDFPDRDVPPIGYIDGIDLVCEGVLTLKKMLYYAEQYASPSYPEIKQFGGKDGASLLAKLLLCSSSDINIFVGRNVNLAHEGLAIDNKSKLDIVVKLLNILTKLGKRVQIKYY